MVEVFCSLLRSVLFTREFVIQTSDQRIIDDLFPVILHILDTSKPVSVRKRLLENNPLLQNVITRIVEYNKE
jgi:hypothetical protein